jgi:hypothetical protein
LHERQLVRLLVVLGLLIVHDRRTGELATHKAVGDRDETGRTAVEEEREGREKGKA